MTKGLTYEPKGSVTKGRKDLPENRGNGLKVRLLRPLRQQLSDLCENLSALPGFTQSAPSLFAKVAKESLSFARAFTNPPLTNVE